MKKLFFILALSTISSSALAEPRSGSTLPPGLKFYDYSTDENLQAAAGITNDTNPDENGGQTYETTVANGNVYSNPGNSKNQYGIFTPADPGKKKYENMTLYQKKDYISAETKKFLLYIMQSQDKYKAMSPEEQTRWLSDQQNTIQKLANENNKLKRQLIIEQENNETEDNNF